MFSILRGFFYILYFKIKSLSGAMKFQQMSPKYHALAKSTTKTAVTGFMKIILT